MRTEAHMITWLEHLWQLYPAQGILIVGAGNGSSTWIKALQCWSAVNVTLIEADDTQFLHLQHQLAAQDGWQLRKQVIAAETGSVTYHHASNPAESGLIEPEALRPLWPNLKTRQASTQQAISLTELLALTEPKVNWLLLDCLPAGALLAGSGDALATCDVIVTRALLPEAGADLPSAQADANTITQLLQAQGFCTVAMETSRHPGVAHTLHVRDHAAQLVQLNVALAQAEQATQKCTAEARQQVDDLTSELAQVREALQQAQQTSQQAALAQVTATQTLEERDAQLKALQTELVQCKKSVQQKAEKTAQLQQQLATVQAEAAQWREAVGTARADAAQIKVLREELAQLQILTTKSAELAKSKEPGALARATDVQEKSQAVACAENLQLKSSQSLKGQDADIDDFMDDLAILFRGMSLNYVDIGAFTGQVYKKLLDSKKVSIREAHLYEPNPGSYSELKKVLISGHAHAYQLAVSDKSGNVNLIPARSMTKIVQDNY